MCTVEDKKQIELNKVSATLEGYIKRALDKSGKNKSEFIRAAVKEKMEREGLLPAKK